YILFFSKITEAIINSDSKISQLQNSISTHRKTVENLKQGQKNEVSAEESENIVSYADEDIISALKGAGIEVETLSETEGAKRVEMTLHRDNIKAIDKLSQYFTYDDFYALRTKDSYKLMVNMGEERESVLPAIVAKEEEDAIIELKREYFNAVLNQENTKEETAEKNTPAKSETPKGEENTPAKTEKTEDEILSDSLLTDVLKPHYQSGQLLPVDELNLEDLSLHSDHGQLSREGDALVLNYDLKDLHREGEFIILLDGEVDVEDLRIELELPQGFQGEVGYYDGQNIPFENFEIEGESVIYSAQRIEGLKGLYYKIKDGSGQIKIKNIEGKI
ncbi:MAG: hypothetical protein Q4D95_01525, partial [Peptoniphilus sp.]|nr:hypothetical protein [Peptoniphilus sp.]